ncbi:MAG: gliding motility-associated C-terminal domain-containing protein [Fluviicola sp.]
MNYYYLKTISLKSFRFLFLMITNYLSGQENLVPNGSFEEYYTCPQSEAYFEGNQLIGCKFWRIPGTGTSDYYNACQTTPNHMGVPDNCLGWQPAFEGNAYAGLVTYVDPGNFFLTASEYIQVKLKEPLEPCEQYQTRFWANLSNCSSRASNFGLRFDNASILPTSTLNEDIIKLPTHIYSSEFISDTIGWTLITGIYEATGGEEYITIGRFWDTTQHTMVNVPNITVGNEYCPLIGTFVGAYYFIDSVSVIPIPDSEPKVTIPNIITPNNDGTNEIWYPITKCFFNWSCEIFNRWGNPVYKFSYFDNGWKGIDQEGKELGNGVYYYRITDEKRVKSGFIELIR